MNKESIIKEIKDAQQALFESCAIRTRREGEIGHIVELATLPDDGECYNVVVKVQLIDGTVYTLRNNYAISSICGTYWGDSISADIDKEIVDVEYLDEHGNNHMVTIPIENLLSIEICMDCCMNNRIRNAVLDIIRNADAVKSRLAKQKIQDTFDIKI